MLKETLLSILHVHVLVGHLQLFVNPRTVASQAPLFMGFSR